MKQKIWGIFFNCTVYREKMLGMKNHFDISDNIEIHEVDIAGDTYI